MKRHRRTISVSTALVLIAGLALMMSVRRFFPTPSEYARPPAPPFPKQEGEVGRLRGHEASISRLFVSADGQSLLSASRDSRILFWKLKNRRLVFSLPMSEQASPLFESATLSSDGHRIAVSYSDGSIHVWAPESGRELLLLHHQEPAPCLALSADGRLLLAGGGRSPIRLWDVNSGEMRSRVPTATYVHCLVLAPDCRRAFAGGAGGELVLLDLVTGLVVRRFRGYENEVWALALSSDGRRLVGGGRSPVIIQWDVETGREQNRYSHDIPYPVHSLAISADGRLALSGGEDGTARFWDLDAGKELRRLEFDCIVWSVALSGRGRAAATGTSRPDIFLWDLTRWLPSDQQSPRLGR